METNARVQPKAFRPRSVSFTVRGFIAAPESVTAHFPVPAESTGLIGTHAQPGKTLLKRSYVRFNLDLPPDIALSQMVPALVKYLGGVDQLSAILQTVKPEHVEIDLVLPIKESLEQEGGFISPTSIADLQRLGATLSFSFLNRTMPAEA